MLLLLRWLFHESHSLPIQGGFNSAQSVVLHVFPINSEFTFPSTIGKLLGGMCWVSTSDIERNFFKSRFKQCM